MRRNVFGTTPESTSPTIVSLNDQKISATHSLADLNLCATIQKKSKVYCVLFFKLTCRIIYARLYSLARALVSACFSDVSTSKFRSRSVASTYAILASTSVKAITEPSPPGETKVFAWGVKIEND